jgi:hypothetical protein
MHLDGQRRAEIRRPANSIRSNGLAARFGKPGQSLREIRCMESRRLFERWTERKQNLKGLVIPKPALSARNLLFVDPGTTDSSRDSPALRNNKSLSF